MEYENRTAEQAESTQSKTDIIVKKSILPYLTDLSVVLCVILILFLFCFRIAVVDGSSMYDTLVHNDYFLLLNHAVAGEPKQGDIIVASKDDFKDGEPIIKRVIATEGQIVDINFDTGTVFVDDVALDEPYLHTLTLNVEGVEFPVTVPEGCLFVMGDNREDSLDSRSPSIGFIDKREILGKAVFLMIPGTGTNECPAEFDFSRIGVIG